MEIKQQVLTDALKKRIFDGFSHHAIAMTGQDEKHESIAFVATNGNDFVGAVVVEQFWGALHVKYVFVDENYRGKGIAMDLMNRAIQYGSENKCSFAFVETMSFQALGFYQKIGFQLEFTRHGYSHGSSFHYLRIDFPQ